MNTLLSAYRTIFGKGGTLYRLFSPYRICPLGAYVDHQHGLVSGFAFDKGIEFLFSATDNGKVEMCSLSFEGLATFNVQRPVEPRQNNWGDYLRGATQAIQHDHILTKGVKGVVRGSMPIGGLSSSAALLCGFVIALAQSNGLELSDMQIIHYASEAERNYVGLRNGILDQACVVLCKENRLLYLDTEDSHYKLLPFGGGEGEPLPFEIGIFFSGVTRQLTGTDYNLRVNECKTAAWMIQAYENIPLKELENTRLRDVPKHLFSKYESHMPERLAKRARHFYTECDRVTAGIKAWQQGDIDTYGRYIFESCESSIHNYECGSAELIALYDIMRQTEGIYGGRFSGAGFKGACISLVNPDKKEEITRTVSEAYLKRFPQHKELFEAFYCKVCDGVKFI